MTDRPTPDALRPGDVVGPWHIEGYAGRGSYGVVFRARRAGHPSSSPVALKVAQCADDPRFVREVGLLSLVQHPALAWLLDRGWWKSSTGAVYPYVVMEWIRGQTLYEWGRRYNPTSRQVMKVVAQLAGAAPAWAGFEAHADHSAAGAPKAMPAPMSAGHLPRPRAVRAALAAATAFAVIALCQGGGEPYEQAQEVAWVEAQDAEEAPDGGTRGLGEEVLAARVDAAETPVPSTSAMMKNVPPQPLDGQRRPPCPRNNVEVVINGGCWYKVDIKPPCGDYYEWQSACYLPVMGPMRVPTTQEP